MRYSFLREPPFEENKRLEEGRGNRMNKFRREEIAQVSSFDDAATVSVTPFLTRSVSKQELIKLNTC